MNPMPPRTLEAPSYRLASLLDAGFFLCGTIPHREAWEGVLLPHARRRGYGASAGSSHLDELP